MPLFNVEADLSILRDPRIARHRGPSGSPIVSGRRATARWAAPIMHMRLTLSMIMIPVSISLGITVWAIATGLLLFTVVSWAF